MKAGWWMVVVAGAFAAGWLGGRQGAPRSDAAPPGKGSLSAIASTGKTSRDAGRRQWGAKLDERTTDDIGMMAKEIPRGDLGPAIEAWFDLYGICGLDSDTVTKAWSLIDAWVAEDFDSAWGWANSIQQPATREFVIKAISGSLAKTDPARAFECLVSNGDFRSSMNDDRLVDLITGLSKESLARSPEDFVAFWKKMPAAMKSVNSFVGVGAEPPPGTDFLALQSAMDRELGGELQRPINPYGIMSAWAKADPDAAVDYLFSRVAAGERIRGQWSEVRSVISETKGSGAANQWTLDMLRDLPEGQRGAFLIAADYQNTPSALLDIVRAGATEEESAAIYGETLQAGVDEGRDWGIRTLLSSLPMEERIRYLKELRGEKAYEAVKKHTTGWNLSEAQMEEIRSAIEAE